MRSCSSAAPPCSSVVDSRSPLHRDSTADTAILNQSRSTRVMFFMLRRRAMLVMNYDTRLHCEDSTDQQHPQCTCVVPCAWSTTCKTQAGQHFLHPRDPLEQSRLSFWTSSSDTLHTGEGFNGNMCSWAPPPTQQLSEQTETSTPWVHGARCQALRSIIQTCSSSANNDFTVPGSGQKGCTLRIPPDLPPLEWGFG